MRIHRTSPKGARYAASFTKPPRPEALEALDEAAIQHQEQAEKEARVYALSTTPGEHIRPRDLQAISKGAVSFNAACRVLEQLEKEDELVRTSSPTYAGMLVWMRAQPATPPGPGYALPLSSKEHGALLRLLDGFLSASNTSSGLRMPAYPSATDRELATLRAIRSRLKAGPKGSA